MTISDAYCDLVEVCEESRLHNVNVMLRFGGRLLAANINPEGFTYYIVGRPKGVSFSTRDHDHDCEAVHG